MAKGKKNNNVFQKIKTFFESVVVEWKKVVKPSKKSLLKYSVATLSFMIIICAFFVCTDLIITLVMKIKGLIG